MKEKYIKTIIKNLTCSKKKKEEIKRQLESDIYNAIHRIGRDAEIAAAEAERKAMNLGLKAVETGAKVADKVAEEADKAVGKAKEKWEK